MYARPIVPIHQIFIPFASMAAKLKGKFHFSPQIAQDAYIPWSDDYESLTTDLMRSADVIGRRLRTLISKDVRFKTIINDLLCSPGAYDAYNTSSLPWILLSYYVASKFIRVETPTYFVERPAYHRDLADLHQACVSYCDAVRKVQDIWVDVNRSDRDEAFFNEVNNLLCSDKVTPLGAPSEEEVALSGIDFAFPFEYERRASALFSVYESDVKTLLIKAFREAISTHCDPIKAKAIYNQVTDTMSGSIVGIRKEFTDALREPFHTSPEYSRTLSRFTGTRGAVPGVLRSVDDDMADLPTPKASKPFKGIKSKGIPPQAERVDPPVPVDPDDSVVVELDRDDRPDYTETESSDDLPKPEGKEPIVRVGGV